VRLTGGLIALGFSSDGKRFIGASSDNRAGPISHDYGVTAMAFSPDGARLLIAAGAQARTWESATGNAPTAPMEHDSTIARIVWVPDGTRALFSDWSNTARIWDAVTGRTVTPPLRQRPVAQGAFSPDGRWLALASDDRVRIWDVSPAHQSLAELAGLAELLGARRLDQTGSLARLQAPELRELWRRQHPESAD